MLFFTHSAGREYDWNELDPLIRDLAEVAQQTQYRDLFSWQELAVETNGATRSGLRYTQAALTQLCRILAPGLGKLVLDLCGAYKAEAASYEEYSMQEAITIFNTVLRRRFEARVLDRYRIVLHAGRRTIDGFLNCNTISLPNRQFLSRTLAAIQAVKRGVLLSEAKLSSRRLSLRLVDRKGWVRDPSGAVIHRGTLLVNDELDTPGTIAWSDLLIDPRDEYYLLGDLRELDPIDAIDGIDDPQLARFFTTAASAGPTKEQLVAKYAKAQSAEIDVPVFGPERFEAITQLAPRLGKGTRVPRRLLRLAILGATFRGDFDPNTPLMDSTAEIVTPTYFYLAKSLAKLAKSKHAKLRDSMERAAAGFLAVR